VFAFTGSVMHLASFGTLLVLCALGCAFFSIKRAPVSQEHSADYSSAQHHS